MVAGVSSQDTRHSCVAEFGNHFPLQETVFRLDHCCLLGMWCVCPVQASSLQKQLDLSGAETSRLQQTLSELRTHTNAQQQELIATQSEVQQAQRRAEAVQQEAARTATQVSLGWPAHWCCTYKNWLVLDCACHLTCVIVYEPYNRLCFW